jgi:hypothetical protein
MLTITGHFEAVVRGEQHCVSFIFDSDDKEGCYECIEVAVSGLTLKPGERKRLVSKACELAAHRLWRGGHGRFPLVLEQRSAASATIIADLPRARTLLRMACLRHLTA